MERKPLSGEALERELRDLDPEDLEAAATWSPEDHRDQAAEFGYVRTPGHNSGCQCQQCHEAWYRTARRGP